MNKLICAVAALLLVLCLPWAGVAQEAENLLVNGDFSQIDGDEPVGWRRDMWLTDVGVSLLSVDPDGCEGNCVTVDNVDENDARFAQTVAVEPNSLYRVSGMIRASDCDGEGYGATLSIQDVFVYSDGLYDTDGEWEYVELYGKTGPDQRTLTVFARVGGYGTLSRGRASFDDLAVTRVDGAPEGAVVYDFFREEVSDSGDDGGNAPGVVRLDDGFAPCDGDEKGEKKDGEEAFHGLDGLDVGIFGKLRHESPRVDWAIDCLPKSGCLRLFSSKECVVRDTFIGSDFVFYVLEDEK